MIKSAVLLVALWLVSGPALAQHVVKPVAITEWKAVFARVEPRVTIPARTRIGGTLTELLVEEGDQVAQGETLARVHDEKLILQLQSVEAQIAALASQLANARTELSRGEDLLKRGVTTAQRLDALRTQVEVLGNRIDAEQARKKVIGQQAAEGVVIAPAAGRVLDVPLTAGGVVMPGEPVAVLAGGDMFLRLAVPERHRFWLKEGSEIRVGKGQTQNGRLAKLYPRIENGRVIADVEIPDISVDFVNARVLVHLPVGSRQALMVPTVAIETRMGLDFVEIQGEGGTVQRTIVPGQTAGEMTEVLSGLNAGDLVVVNHD